YYELYCVSGEPHGVIRFKGAFSSLTWENPVSEYWHGFTVGIKTSSNDLQNVKGEFLNGSGAVIATGSTMLISYDPTLASQTGTLDTTISSARLTETNAALTGTGSMSLYDVDTTNVVTASVQSVAISGVFNGLTLTNAQVLSLLTVSTTDTNALQLSKVNWSFNSGSETFDWLAAGEELTFTYTIEVNDNQGATSTTTVTVTIVGTNDTAVLTNGVVTGAIVENSGNLTRSGSVSFLDPDLRNTATARVINDSLVWTGGTLSASQQTNLNAAFSITPTSIASNSGTITWTYAPTESLLDFLAANETLTAKFYIEVTDSSSKAVSTLVTLTVTGTNDSPVLADTALTFSAIEDQAVPAGAVGALISTLTGGVTEADTTNSKGVAITALDTTQGVWYYSLNAGSTWVLISSAPTATAALLLPTEARLYFKPTANWNGVIDPAITLRAWDRSTGSSGGTADTTTNGGTTAFSSTTDTVALTVTAVNAAPTRLLSSVTLSGSNEDLATAAATISSLFNGSGSNAAYSDATDQVTGTGSSSAQSMAGIVLVGNASTPTQGTWQDSADGSTNWTAIGTSVSTTAGVYLPSSYSLRFNPSAIWNGNPGQLTVRLVDSSSAAPAAGSTTVNVTTSGGTTIYSDSSNAVTLVTTIAAVNDAPVASGSSTLTAVNEDTASPAGATVTSLFTSNFSDATDSVTSGSSANTLAGIAIIGYTADASKGEWQYSSDGSTWSTIS
ncbi:MAG: beta strand repeat-containing protein, partial [Gemmataceae bacterium]